jgi:hypothetical protein
MPAFFNPEPSLKAVGDRILTATWNQFPTLGREQIALTWLMYETPVRTGTRQEIKQMGEAGLSAVKSYSYRSDVLIYPASVVKLFYLVAVHHWFAQGKLQSNPELERAMTDMIVDSSNDATGFVMDMLTDTTSGPDLPAPDFEIWQHQRNQVNQYLQTLSWPELAVINANQKTWCDGPYGRERTFLGPDYHNRNALTTNASARLLHAIVTGTVVSPQACQAMLPLMLRSLDPTDLAADPENQVTGFLGAGVPQTAQVWSKAGLMSRVRHDAAYIELTPQVNPYLLVVFTEGREHSDNEEILPFVSQQVANWVLGT